jgi:PTS system fructose-specific IIA component
MQVSGLLAPERVRVPLASDDKDGVLGELVDLVVRSRRLHDLRVDIRRAVLERERVLSTGIGGGIALPHAKYRGMDQLVMAAGVCPTPVEYGALNGEPARLFFLMLGPYDPAGEQVRVLSRISRLMREGSLSERLIAAADAGQFLSLLWDAESAL